MNGLCDFSCVSLFSRSLDLWDKLTLDLLCFDPTARKVCDILWRDVCVAMDVMDVMDCALYVCYFY
jgi:hypothetical protein